MLIAGSNVNWLCCERLQKISAYSVCIFVFIPFPPTLDEFLYANKVQLPVSGAEMKKTPSVCAVSNPSKGSGQN